MADTPIHPQPDLIDRLHEWNLARVDRRFDALDAAIADIQATLAALTDALARG
jgi:hypothetical protein